MSAPRRVARRCCLGIALALVAILAVACASGAPATTPRPVAGTEEAPRDVNLIAKDYTFLPSVLDLVPGETIVLHVINGGLEVHEAVIGDARVQAAWEVAEAGTVGAPPGPTPVVSVPPDVAGLRVVVRSGERVDVRWTVPTDVPATGATDALASPGGSPDPGAWLVGCHIPGHWAQGMWIPIRWVTDPVG
jgi:uncharacterized cupredoxin-like copper-binding protein